MTQNKIIQILKVKSIETSAKEIYKLHLEEMLAESHCIYDIWCKTDVEGFHEYIVNYNQELETKLKELE